MAAKLYTGVCFGLVNWGGRGRGIDPISDQVLPVLWSAPARRSEPGSGGADGRDLQFGEVRKLGFESWKGLDAAGVGRAHPGG